MPLKRHPQHLAQRSPPQLRSSAVIFFIFLSIFFSLKNLVNKFIFLAILFFKFLNLKSQYYIILILFPRHSPHKEEEVSVFQVPDPGAGAGVLLQRLHQQREEASVVQNAQPHRPPG